MDREANLKLAKGLLAEHVQDSLPPKSNKHIKDFDVVTLDASICALVANLIKYDGEIVEINSFYKESGIEREFVDLLADAQRVLDKVLPRLRDEQSKTYFSRLGKLSVVAAEIGLAQKLAGEETQDSPVVKEEKGFAEIRKTADLDLGLLEFTKQLARDKGLDVD